MPSKSFQNYHRSLVSIYRLIEALDIIKGSHKGKRALDHFTRSSVLILAAAWESYIEDVILESATYLTVKLNSPLDLPDSVKEQLSEFVKINKTDFKPLQLAGDGWKDVFLELINFHLFGDSGLNTPKPHKINALFKKLLGYEEDVTKDWRINHNKIREFVELRGLLAHRVKFEGYIKKNEVNELMTLVNHAVRNTDQSLLEHLSHITLYQPWKYTYNK